MATRRVKNEDERLDDAHMERVIAFLEPKEGKPGTISISILLQKLYF